MSNSTDPIQARINACLKSGKGFVTTFSHKARELKIVLHKAVLRGASPEDIMKAADAGGTLTQDESFGESKDSPKLTNKNKEVSGSTLSALFADYFGIAPAPVDPNASVV